MLRYQTAVRRSDIDGLGLFAAERIPAGALLWAFDEGLDRILDAHQPLPPAARAFVATYAYAPLGRPEILILCVDDARFMNHSDMPNTVVDPADGTTCARHEISAGEEITCDYFSFADRSAGCLAGLLSASRAAAAAALPAARERRTAR